MNMHSSAQADSTVGRRFWLAHVRALAESGFSRREYCRRHQLSYDCLTDWVRKHRSGAEPAQLTALVEMALRHHLGCAAGCSKSSLILIRPPWSLFLARWSGDDALARRASGVSGLRRHRYAQIY